jgi:hypothetical protein
MPVELDCYQIRPPAGAIDRAECCLTTDRCQWALRIDRVSISDQLTIGQRYGRVRHDGADPSSERG